MGFMDKAKKMAEQAQAKLDEVQGQINKSSPPTQQHDGPAVEYDKHGRPIQPAPVTPDAPPVATAGPPPAATPGVPPTEPAQPEAGPTPDPAAPKTPGTPPAAGSQGLTSGDPLAG
jgi:hypothetical protein